jgi:hypothetical protein
MAFEPFDDFELRTARVMRIVVLDFGPLKHETDGSIGKVQAYSHFGIAFVRAVTQSDEAAEALPSIVKVVVCTFVEIGLAGVRMHQVVLLKQYYFEFRH